MGAHDRFLLCPPRFYRIAYVINPWMCGNVGRTDEATAHHEWEHLCAALTARAAIELVEPAEGLPDMAFVANAGLVHGDVFVPSRLRFPQRQAETPVVTAWFRDHGYAVTPLPGEGCFEGEGDALFQPGEPLLWAGYGVRSAREAVDHLAALLDVEVVPLRLVDERFYHLDTAFCPLPGGRVVYHPGAFDAEARATMAARIPADRRYAVDIADALAFACNALVADGAYVTSFVSAALRARLARWGHEVVTCALGEFLLAGGGAKCLALSF